MKSVLWEPTKGNHFQAQKGVDELGNIYTLSANKETVTVRTPDGYTGIGWTAEEALESAHATKSEAILDEFKAESIEDAIQAPPNLSIEALSYWHKRACEVLDLPAQSVTILTA
jgi:hypothetical protein